MSTLYVVGEKVDGAMKLKSVVDPFMMLPLMLADADAAPVMLVESVLPPLMVKLTTPALEDWFVKVSVSNDVAFTLAFTVPAHAGWARAQPSTVTTDKKLATRVKFIFILTPFRRKETPPQQ